MRAGIRPVLEAVCFRAGRARGSLGGASVVSNALRRNNERFPATNYRLQRRCFSSERAMAKIGQPVHPTHPHLVKGSDLVPGLPHSEFSTRRAKLFESLPQDSCLIVPANPELYFSHDVSHRFRQDSNFFYLTGFLEPDAVAVFSKGEREEFVLFVRPRDEKKMTWEGPVAGTEGAVSVFGADKAFTLDDLENVLPQLIRSSTMCFFSPRKHSPQNSSDARVSAMLELLKSFSAKALSTSPSLLAVEEKRLLKSPAEIEILRKSCQIAASAFVEVMEGARPGILESDLMLEFEYEVRRRGASRLAYGAIVASGENANTLHYVQNSDLLR